MLFKKPAETFRSSFHKKNAKCYKYLIYEILAMQKKIPLMESQIIYEGWNFNSGNYLFTTDTK